MGEICAECGAAGPWRVRGLQWCGEHKPGVWDPYRGEGMARKKVDSEPEAAKPAEADPPVQAATPAETVKAAEPVKVAKPRKPARKVNGAARPKRVAKADPTVQDGPAPVQELAAGPADAVDPVSAEEALRACARLAMGREERDQVTTEWNRAHDQLRAAQAEVGRLQCELDTARGELDTARGQQAAPREPDPTTQTEISALRAEVARLQEALTDRAAQVEHLARDLDDQGSAVARWSNAAQETICVLTQVAVEIGCPLRDLGEVPERVRERIKRYRARISELQAAKG